MKKWIEKYTGIQIITVVSIFYILVLSWALTSCAPQHFTPLEKTVYSTAKTLESAVVFRDTGLKVAGDLYKQGLLDEDTKDKIIKLGDDLKEVINMTKEVLKIYNSSGGNRSDLQEQLMLYHTIYGEFSDLIMPYVIDKMGGE